MSIKHWVVALALLGGLAFSMACNQTIPTTSPAGVLLATLGPTPFAPPFTVITSPAPTPTVTPTPTLTPFPTPTPISTVTCPFSLVTQWGAPGTGNGQFNGGSDVAVDGSGNVYVLDSGNKRVQKFTSVGGYLLQWNDAPVSFVAPINIGFNPADSRVYVLDSTATTPTSGVVKLFDANGNVYPGWSVPANSVGMDIDGAGNVYIGAQSTAIKYDQNGANPQYYYNHSVNGSAFSGVQALAVDANGNLFVATGSSIQKFNSSRQYIVQWGSPGTGQGQFTGIAYMCTDASGNVYVTDNYLSGGVATGRIQKFDNSGNFICYYQTGGAQFEGVRLSVGGNIYVVDGKNQLVLKF